MIKKRAVCLVVVLTLLIVLLYLATLLLMPKHMGESRDGALIGEYYGEIDRGMSHEVLFVGDCEVYECFIPAILWERYGITAYVRGSPQQLVWQSYYLLEEMLSLEKPKVVVFNVLAMKYGEPQNEAYNRLTLDGMKMSRSKLSAIKASMTKEEKLSSYIFPLLRYHSRWKELSHEDFQYIFKCDKISHNGYLLRREVKGVTNKFEGSPLPDYTLPEICFEYIDKMNFLCKENRAELVLVKAPTNSWKYWWYDEWDKQICDYAEREKIDYYNFIGNEEIGIDWSQDTYDGGVHLNVWGAEKTTYYFGRILAEGYGIESQKGNKKLADAWEEKLELYYKERDNG